MKLFITFNPHITNLSQNNLLNNFKMIQQIYNLFVQASMTSKMFIIIVLKRVAQSLRIMIYTSELQTLIDKYSHKKE